MKSKLLLLLSILLFTGCIKETLAPCPTGDVKIDIYVEKFQVVTHDYQTDMESSFNTRIKNIHYFLFKNNELMEEGHISDCTSYVNPLYTFQRKGLDFGDYCLAVVSNCSSYVGGNAPSELFFTYAGVENKEDYFATCFPFRIDCNCLNEYKAYMERAHGVTRFTFSNIPEDIKQIDVTITNVGNKKMIEGDYSGLLEVTKQIPIQQLSRANKSDKKDLTIVLGTFPTANKMKSAYRLQLYKNDKIPSYNEMAIDTLSIRRNQLLDIATNFNDDTPSFEVRLNTTWEGANSGGETDIN